MVTFTLTLLDWFWAGAFLLLMAGGGFLGLKTVKEHTWPLEDLKIAAGRAGGYQRAPADVAPRYHRGGES